MNIAYDRLHANGARRARSAGSPRRSTLARVGAGLWAWLEAVGHARAKGHLIAAARRYDAVEPGLAAQLRVAARDRPR